jgi:hypothetical protein
VLTCDHCFRAFDGVRYRVKSEERGIILLDMMVCYDCYAEARKLGHHGGHLSAWQSGMESQIRLKPKSFSNRKASSRV